MRSKKIPGVSDISENNLASKELVGLLEKEDGFNNINTITLKMEMYVDEQKWKGSSTAIQELLNAFVKTCESRFLSRHIVKMMNKRLHAKAAGVDHVNRKLSKIKVVKLQDAHSKQHQPAWQLNESLLVRQRQPPALDGCEGANLDSIKMSKSL